MRVERSNKRRTDRWYDLRFDQQLSFGAWRTGPIRQSWTSASGSDIRVAGIERRKQKAHNSMEFELYSPHGETVRVTSGSSRRDRDWEFAGVEIDNTYEDRIKGTVDFSDGQQWTFDIENFHAPSAIGDDTGGWILSADGVVINVIEDNSQNETAGFLKGFAGARFEYQGVPVGRVTLTGSSIRTLHHQHVRIASDSPPKVQSAIAAVATVLLATQEIDGPDG